ncbi:hypothetical protein EDB85DRAFT_1153808 [Lactarius pseudohatsudake]|nr:hypothetical protein EDB85DRAFT_1153808 [Lactarius pseudohatsudake]
MTQPSTSVVEMYHNIHGVCVGECASRRTGRPARPVGITGGPEMQNTYGCPTLEKTATKGPERALFSDGVVSHSLSHFSTGRPAVSAARRLRWQRHECVIDREVERVLSWEHIEEEFALKSMINEDMRVRKHHSKRETHTRYLIVDSAITDVNTHFCHAFCF